MFEQIRYLMHASRLTITTMLLDLDGMSFRVGKRSKSTFLAQSNNQSQDLMRRPQYTQCVPVFRWFS
ncbi:unnamed protein product [Schistosoma mattheei]|uniref:Uncharacterized protein n=1 Tax=Schistosoma mattheei TaxID=31246 RepID=A0A183P6J9_9TREM|nr:unnamed protein product [Schistosoma mattheei]